MCPRIFTLNIYERETVGDRDRIETRHETKRETRHETKRRTDTRQRESKR